MVAERQGYRRGRVVSSDLGKGDTNPMSQIPPSVDVVRDVLAMLPNDDKPWDLWADVMWSLKNDFGDNAEVRDLFLAWSAKAESHHGKTRKRARSQRKGHAATPPNAEKPTKL